MLFVPSESCGIVAVCVMIVTHDERTSTYFDTFAAFPPMEIAHDPVP